MIPETSLGMTDEWRRQLGLILRFRRVFRLDSRLGILLSLGNER